ncbi:MAG: hypothetical protein MMC33_002406 [Icmadophila ericetorum]|nr:hypothetical protein [Icmadophila ericetorum]
MAKSMSVLPPEILQAVIACIEDRPTLCNLARCSHYFYQVTVPFLYEHVDLHDHEGGNGEHSFKYLRPLTSLLLQRADLAYLVRHLTMREEFSDGGDSEDKVKEGISIDTVEVEDVFKLAIEGASHTEEEEKEWLTHLSWTDHADALVALLLPALIQLEKLDLQFLWIAKYFERMIQRVGLREKPFDKQRAFLSLQDFMHTWFDEKYGMTLEYVAMFLRFPAINRIFGHRIGSDREELNETLALLDAGSSTVTHLELKDCKLNTKDIIHLLNVPRSLKTFIYELGGGHLSYSGFNFNAIHKALAHQAHCLENLWLDYEHRYGIGFDNHLDDTTPLPSLASFKNLDFVKIATVFLFGDNDRRSENPAEELDPSNERYWNSTTRRRLTRVFPYSLERLHILHYEDHIQHTAKALADLLENKAQNIPKLKELVIEGAVNQMMNLWDEMADLTKLAESEDISLIVVHDVCKARGYDEFVERGWGLDGEIAWAEGVNSLNEYPVNEIYRCTTEGWTRLQ